MQAIFLFIASKCPIGAFLVFSSSQGIKTSPPRGPTEKRSRKEGRLCCTWPTKVQSRAEGVGGGGNGEPPNGTPDPRAARWEDIEYARAEKPWVLIK